MRDVPLQFQGLEQLVAQVSCPSGPRVAARWPRHHGLITWRRDFAAAEASRKNVCGADKPEPVSLRLRAQHPGRVVGALAGFEPAQHGVDDAFYLAGKPGAGGPPGEHEVVDGAQQDGGCGAPNAARAPSQGVRTSLPRTWPVWLTRWASAARSSGYVPATVVIKSPRAASSANPARSPVDQSFGVPALKGTPSFPAAGSEIVMIR